MEHADSILETFPDADLSLIEEVLFFGGWQSYEEAAGYLIFRGIDGSIQLCVYGFYVMDGSPNSFQPEEISEEKYRECVAEMTEAMNKDFL